MIGCDHWFGLYNFCGVFILLCPCGMWLVQYCAILFLIAYCCIKFDVPEYFLEYCVPMIMALRNMVYHVAFAAFMIMVWSIGIRMSFRTDIVLTFMYDMCVRRVGLSGKMYILVRWVVGWVPFRKWWMTRNGC